MAKQEALCEYETKNILTYLVIMSTEIQQTLGPTGAAAFDGSVYWETPAVDLPLLLISVQD